MFFCYCWTYTVDCFLFCVHIAIICTATHTVWFWPIQAKLIGCRYNCFFYDCKSTVKVVYLLNSTHKRRRLRFRVRKTNPNAHGWRSSALIKGNIIVHSVLKEKKSFKTGEQVSVGTFKCWQTDKQTRLHRLIIGHCQIVFYLFLVLWRFR